MKNRPVGTRFLATLALTAALAGPAAADVVTNKDVLSLLEAGMSEDVILELIASGTPKFDTSSKALIRLKEKGASPTILKAMMQNRDNSASSSGPSSKSVHAGGLNPEEVVMVLDGKEAQMQYIVPGLRTAARALGFGGIATYAVLQGERAQKRLPASSQPEFVVSVPKNAQAPNYLTLANFAARNNQTREVLTGGGFMSYTTGIHRDRVIPVTTEQLANQSRAKDGFILYRVKPENPLPTGEYALVLYTAEVRTAGFFAQGANSFFDFGVD